MWSKPRDSLFRTTTTTDWPTIERAMSHWDTLHGLELRHRLNRPSWFNNRKHHFETLTETTMNHIHPVPRVSGNWSNFTDGSSSILVIMYASFIFRFSFGLLTWCRKRLCESVNVNFTDEEILEVLKSVCQLMRVPILSLEFWERWIYVLPTWKHS
jgi:hypothetical protein